MKRVIGLMSGTSLDGIDAALIETDGVRIAAFGPGETVPYTREDRAILQAAVDAALDWQFTGPAPDFRRAEAVLTDRHAEAAERVGEFDVIATVKGGGLSGQAGAVRHGISRALTLFEPGLRPALKAGGFLTRDPRVVERKKYGKAKARRSFQFSKR